MDAAGLPATHHEKHTQYGTRGALQPLSCLPLFIKHHLICITFSTLLPFLAQLLLALISARQGQTAAKGYLDPVSLFLARDII